MTVTVFLVRHAVHDHIGHVLSGRLPGLSLSMHGQVQANNLASRFAEVNFAAIQTSPVERASETARTVAGDRPVEVVDALTEIDFGEWTGRSFDSLEEDDRWRSWNRQRGTARAPGGEAMAEAQARIVRHVEAAAVTFPGAALLMVSHCDMIRAMICHVLGMTLDNLLRFDIDPASTSVIQAGDWGMRLVRLNDTGAP